MWRRTVLVLGLAALSAFGLLAQSSLWPASRVSVSGVAGADDLQEAIDEGSIGGGTFDLAAGETPANLRLVLFGSNDATEMKVAGCSFNADLDAISCDQGDAGQALTALEASANGTNSFSIQAPDALNVSRNFRPGTTTGQLPPQVIEGGELICVHHDGLGVAASNPIRLIPPAPRARTISSTVVSWCANFAGVDGTSDCASTGGGGVYTCPTAATGVDFPQDCTQEGTITVGREYLYGGTFSTSSGDGVIAAGQWAVLTGGLSGDGDGRADCISLVVE